MSSLCRSKNLNDMCSASDHEQWIKDTDFKKFIFVGNPVVKFSSGSMMWRLLVYRLSMVLKCSWLICSGRRFTRPVLCCMLVYARICAL